MHGVFEKYMFLPELHLLKEIMVDDTNKYFGITGFAVDAFARNFLLMSKKKESV